jgi:hypothetical protein
MRGDGKNQLKISAPHPMTETYRLIPVPLLAALISLDSPFKFPKAFGNPFMWALAAYRNSFMSALTA